MESNEGEAQEKHVLLVPYPSQGHVNPILQFAKRLAFFGLKPTLAVTRFLLKTSPPEPGLVGIEPISDGFDEGGYAQAESIPAYLARFESVGPETLDAVVRSGKYKAVIYDAFLPWVLEVGKKYGLVTAAFFTQSCAVDAVLGHVYKGRVSLPWTEPELLLDGLPGLGPNDLPSFLSDPVDGPYPAYLQLVLNQFLGLEKADEVFINSVYELEPQEAEWMKKEWGAKTIGPTIPSKYLDNQIPGDTHYGFHLFAGADRCNEWLDAQPPRSVIYVSFGSMANLDHESMRELAKGLEITGKPFLWVVRASERGKLEENFNGEGKGRVCEWSEQLEVLGHGSVGCFVTHCGWNSTVEALAAGMAMVAVPQWTDQPMNGKYVEGVWGVGVRARKDENGVVRGEEIGRCVMEVMEEGDKSGEIWENASKWKRLSVEAMMEGGSSYNNILGFVEKYYGRVRV
ncbi:UDP-glycosyltransferase 74F2-like isoform X1 [Dioscorea cayenensis subsp. rotundata]|uniref:UDP-glycosyltransferase 74F2-like isoform X1 n=1 Tax=Dioscorea cayennensis subsp. rotundata TaxID=55577 RepID=A0AB40B8T6_DIOCR|nr:UDP-glycosyltransferase 74F2-like isoform X1 [Dioscorea cayenensis subsp. rotundata]